MCGIAGIVGAPSRGVLDAMLTALDHRGPDDRGVHVSGGAGLGMTRLAIIDLVTGRQPMTGEDGAATIVFNGEIYNFRAVRAELEAAGHRFRTQSDTEAIIEGYLEHGIGVLDKLAGMFALALWDRRTRDLFLIRDRLGVKPMYWTALEDDSGIAFASELTALRRAGCANRGLNRVAVCNFVALSYVPGVESAIDGVNRLEPGMNGGWIQLAGPVSRFDEFRLIETTMFGSNLQQTRFPPSQLAPTGDEALARLFMLPGATYSDPADGTPDLLIRQAGGELTAMSAVCTHAGCTVGYENGQVVCPCHGATYDARSGAVTGGPAPQGLARKRVVESGGSIYAVPA